MLKIISLLVLHLYFGATKGILKKMTPYIYCGQGSVIRSSDHIDEKGVEMFEQARKLNIEGIVAKNRIYRPGIKGKQWLKTKAIKTMNAVIAGFL